MFTTLKSKFLFWSALLLVFVAAPGALSIWSAAGMSRTARVTSAEYDAMDRADAAAVQAAWLRDSLNAGDPATYRNLQFFVPIQNQVVEVVRELRAAAAVNDGDGVAERDLAQAVSDHLDEAIRLSGDTSASNTSGKSPEVAAELEQVHQALATVVKLMPESARHHATSTADRMRVRLIWMCVLLLITLGLSIFVHFRQFRTLVGPLLWLRDDMQRSAAHDFREPIRPRGDREFKDVASYFNGLARELAQLYKNLEEKVIAKSRELVRSERLASVGFLAAGVAHEINNPLSVIAGYAELAEKSLRRIMLGPGVESGTESNADGQAEAEAEALAGALDAQEIIRDEAFRCKEITNRLLSLARGGEGGRQPLCLDEVARQVTVLTKGLKNYRDRRLILDFKPNDSMEIVGNATEMKQVLLNLTVNALEAVPNERGEVRIGGRRTDQWVEVSVQDNGKGMTPETLQHVFEPFFTAKRGAGEPGTGLGLSITHAIVENHGGRIRAESAGPGRGSRFTVRFPAMPRGAASVAAALG